jgi:hypothetical protein
MLLIIRIILSLLFFIMDVETKDFELKGSKHFKLSFCKCNFDLLYASQFCISEGGVSG